MKIFINLIKGVIIIPIFLVKMLLGTLFSLLAYLVAIGEGNILKAENNIFGRITNWFYNTADRLY